jgi:tetratricopeptide (TPR) repeat protein
MTLSDSQAVPASTALEEVRARLARENGVPVRLVIDAPPGSGKTSLLLTLRAQLGEDAILLAPPLGAPDGAEAALSGLADELQERALGLDSAPHIADPDVPFEEKLRALIALLGQVRRPLALLCDGPGLWGGSASEEGQARSARLLSALAEATQDLALVTSTPIAGVWNLEGADQLRLAPYRLGLDELYELQDWDGLDAQVEQVAAWLRPGTLLGPHVFRLLVLLALLDVPQRQWTTHPVHLARALARRLTGDSTTRPLAAAWRQIAVFRASFAPELLEAAVRQTVEQLPWELVRQTLIERDPVGSWRMPRLLREAAFGDPNRRQLPAREDHDAAVRYYRARLTDGHEASLGARVERVYHVGLRVDVAALLEVPLVFREQLHHIGWWLSAQQRDFASAAEVFRVAVARDAKDAYAQHYLAYNLDVLGREPDAVEAGYRAALRRDPGRVWWHSRWIRFLVSRERIAQAHEAWHDARSELLPPDAGQGSAQLYQELHRDVARWLLYAVELDFAREVLDDVPASVVGRYPDFIALRERVEQLDAIDPEADYVPLWHAATDWAQRGPFLLRRELGALGVLETWWAGKIDLVEDDLALLSVAAVDATNPARNPEPREARVPVAQLEADSGQIGAALPGRFVEIGFYRVRDGDQLILASIHPERDPSERLLPSLYPAALRYLSEPQLYPREP